MRIAIVCAEISPFSGGGISASVRATVQALAGAGHHVDVFSRGSYRAQAITCAELPVFTSAQIQWHWVTEPANDDPRWHARMGEFFDDALARTYRHHAPDLVELHDYQGLGAHIAMHRAGGALGDAVVATRLHTSLEQVAHLDAVPADPELSQLERVGLIASDLLIAPSEAVATFYRTFYAPLELPPIAIQWSGFLRDDAPSPLPAREPTGDLELLLLGRLQRFKGTDRLVRALVASPELPIRLTLVGGDTPTAPTGSMRAYVRSLAAHDSRISIVGPVPRRDVAAYLAQADCLVVSSIWETWGNVGLEGLAAARPLIVTPCASLPEMAGHGAYGLVADGHECADLNAVLHQAVADQERLRALAGDPALPAHMAALTDDDAVAAGYAAIAGRAERTPHQSPDAWRTVVENAASERPRAHAAHATVPAISTALQTTFRAIYDDATWTDALPAMPRSGRGSLPEYSASVIEYVTQQVDDGSVRSIADIGCGDLAYVKEIPAIVGGQVDYLGLDIVPSLIDEHQPLTWGTFAVADITAPGFRVDADLVLVKDVLFHLDNEQVAAAIDNLRASRFNTLLVTSIDGADNTSRVFDRWHYAPIDLTAPPYCLRPESSLERVGGAFHIFSRASLDRA
jgi:glycosyltransferase involved in cell wall biosynthesis